MRRQHQRCAAERVGMGIAVCVAVGTAIGTLVDSLALGMGVGIVIGAGLGAARDGWVRDTDRPGTGANER